jgi:hypothetical protein
LHTDGRMGWMRTHEGHDTHTFGRTNLAGGPAAVVQFHLYRSSTRGTLHRLASTRLL